MKSLIVKHPWLLVVAAFALLLSAWSVLIVVAANNQPERIEIEADSDKKQ